MGLKIIISSAVDLSEKTCVKHELEEMQKQRIIQLDYIYDCNEHGTFWGLESKQERIYRMIREVDWFICLIPHYSVGITTWKELECILKIKKEGKPVIISVFHPLNTPEEYSNKTIGEDRKSFQDIQIEAKKILGNELDQYVVNYDFNDEKKLVEVLRAEYVKLYFTDKVFRSQHLNSLAKLGKEISAADLYFDKERADPNNGFVRNKYFPRASVDGELETALIEQRKIIIITGAPGSGKTRAIYQLFTDPNILDDTGKERYALGKLQDKSIIVIDRNNINDVYNFLVSEGTYTLLGDKLQEYYLICDQIKDVFGKLPKEDLFKFFDLVEKYKHISFIATSIPSSFNNFCERWNEYGHKPLEDDQLTKIIQIPLISSDQDGNDLRDWLHNEMHGNKDAETIGDYIPNLNKYKQAIVNKIYDKIESLPYLQPFLTAIQITETYRHDTALFLPVIIAQKNISHHDDSFKTSTFLKEIVKTINFLIDNNVIWITKPKGNIAEKMSTKDFGIEYGMDQDSNFYFDGEFYKESPISTSYSYGVNEIVWNEIENQDADRHMNESETVLKDFQKTQDVVRSAKEFYRAFPYISSLRRILPRIPHTDCYAEVSECLWSFIFEKCDNSNPTELELQDFVITIGILISRANNLDEAKKAITILLDKNISPNYNTIGELYLLSTRLRTKEKEEIQNYISNIRSEYRLTDDSFFSKYRLILHDKTDFEQTYNSVCESKYCVDTITGEKIITLDKVSDETISPLQLLSLKKLLGILANKAENFEQWEKVLKLHQLTNVKLKRSLIRQYFSVASEENNKTKRDISNCEPQNIIRERLAILLSSYFDIIEAEDGQSCYFYSIEYCRNFKQALPIYEMYLSSFDEDNPRLISIVLHSVRDYEYQKALNFLIKTDNRLKKKGREVGYICYNNLIKTAPNLGEALAVVPHLSHIQDHTLALILNVLKKKNKKKKEKFFYYAYDVVMQDHFFNLRKNPYVIGALHNLATTPKHERFIRDVFLSHISEPNKKDLIDYSTSIASIRMKKDYRSLDDAWVIFNTCRNYYRNKKKYIKSDLYSNLMMRIKKLCDKNESLLIVQQKKVSAIIEEDFSRILRDGFFYSSLYRFLPQKKIIDNSGTICGEFAEDMEKSNISHVKAFNNIMLILKERSFDSVWTFYEFIVNFYQKHNRWKTLRPDIYTVSNLMESVENSVQLEKAEAAAKRWISETELCNSSIYQSAYSVAKKNAGITITPTSILSTNDYLEKIVKREKNTHRDYEKEVDLIIDKAVNNINLDEILTSTLFNQYLQQTLQIIKDYSSDKSLERAIVKNFKSATYYKISDELIKKNTDKINFDNISYVNLIHMSPTENEAKEWINKLVENKDIYKYNLVVCAALAQEYVVARTDITVSRVFFGFWENIMNDIGYDPSDSSSYSILSAKSEYQQSTDYDGYWLTKGGHALREMNHYEYMLTIQHKVDLDSLRIIKKILYDFDLYGIKCPQPVSKGHPIIDYRKEILKLQD